MLFGALKDYRDAFIRWLADCKKRSDRLLIAFFGLYTQAVNNMPRLLFSVLFSSFAIIPFKFIVEWCTFRPVSIEQVFGC